MQIEKRLSKFRKSATGSFMILKTTSSSYGLKEADGDTSYFKAGNINLAVDNYRIVNQGSLPKLPIRKNSIERLVGQYNLTAGDIIVLKCNTTDILYSMISLCCIEYIEYIDIVKPPTTELLDEICTHFSARDKSANELYEKMIICKMVSDFTNWNVTTLVINRVHNLVRSLSNSSKTDFTDTCDYLVLQLENATTLEKLEKSINNKIIGMYSRYNIYDTM